MAMNIGEFGRKLIRKAEIRKITPERMTRKRFSKVNTL